LQEVQLYPNPTQNQSVLRWTSNSSAEVELQLRDALGRQLQVKQALVGEESWVIGVSALSAGMYFVTLQQERNLVSKKLLITR